VDDLSDYELSRLNDRLKTLNEPGCFGSFFLCVAGFCLGGIAIMVCGMTVSFYAPIRDMHCAWVPTAENNAYVYTCYNNTEDIPPGAHS